MDLNKMIRNTKADLTDKDILISPEFKAYLDRKAHAVHCDWHIPDVPCYIAYNEADYVAYTDNVKYFLNAGHEIVSGTIEEKLDILRGMLMHEIGHRLFTSFSAAAIYLSTLKTGILYPEIPKVNIIQEPQLKNLMEYISESGQAEKLTPIVKYMINILEDGRIEYLLQNYATRHMTLINGLTVVQQKMYDKMTPFPELSKQVDDAEKKVYEVFIQVLLHYVRFGEIKDFEISMADDKIIKVFDKAQHYVDVCVESLTSMEFYKSVNQLLVILWPDIKEYIDSIEDEMQSEEGGSASKKETESPAPSDVANVIENQLAKTQGLSSDNNQSLDGEDDLDTQNMLNKMLANKDDGNTSSAPPPYTRTTLIHANGTGKLSKFAGFREHSNTTDIDLNRLKSAISERVVDDKLEHMLENDLKDFKSSINFGAVHAKTDCRIYRHDVSEENRNNYALISPDLIKLAKNIAKKQITLQKIIPLSM